ncbi:MAG: class I SAM-dependent methyltransferase [Acidimicrobiia bacterium]
MTLEAPLQRSDDAKRTRLRTPTSTPASTPAQQGRAPSRPPNGAAASVAPLITAMLGGKLTIRFDFWDGSSLGPADPVGVIIVRSADALRRLIWSPNELGVSRAFVAGDLEVEGDIYAVLTAVRDVSQSNVKMSASDKLAAVAAARRIGAIGRPLPPPPEEARPAGWRRHTKRRDAEVIGHHYDVGNDFYRIVLGPSMTYSCARFSEPGMDLASAQASKLESICRKLGLHERAEQRLLDVGCGWGSMAMHAARHHSARVVGVTISKAQAEAARKRVDEAGLADRVEIRLQDYRDLRGETFDAISSVGMSEHVGSERIDEYFGVLRSVLRPYGRLLNHAISSVNGSKMSKRGFIYRYVFPDGELLDVGTTVLAMERAGFEVRDLESLREHYALTLRCWVANLEAEWDRAVELAGEARARIWRLYMAGSAVGFEDGGLNVHQVLGVVPDETGTTAMPLTRDGWTTRT